jgi:glycosyltransferase involved in cell wall biosynthesis
MGLTGKPLKASCVPSSGEIIASSAIGFSDLPDRAITWLWKSTRPFQPGFAVYGAQYAPRPIVELDSESKISCPENPPAVSIVVPSRNQGEFLSRCLKSIVGQHYPNLELIVVDGGSEDQSREILNEHSAFISWWCSEPDGGQVQGLNKGFQRTTGEIMGWVNADDMLMPGALARVAGYFRMHPEIDVVYGLRILIDTEDREIGRWIIPPHENGILSRTDAVPQETLFWRRKIWEQVGAQLDESYSFAMDWELLIRFRDAGAKMVRLPCFLGMFRVHPGQKTHPDWNRIGNEEMQRLRKRCLGFAPSRLSIVLLTLRYLLWARFVEILWKTGLLDF